MSRRLLLGAVTIALMFVAVPRVEASAILPNTGFNTTALAANDDGSTGLVNVGFTFNFYGLSQSQVYINNNGNITFTGPLGTFTPFNLLTTNTPMIAPFFGDVDTRGASNVVRYGTDTVDGHDAFGVNWINVGYFNGSPGPNRNSFQLVLIDRSDVAAGAFDFMFNYDLVQWEAGQASGSDANGCGGSSARVGYSNGTDTAFELTGSAIDGAFLDSGLCLGNNPPGPNALIFNSLNSNVDGRYFFGVRDGQVQPPVGAVPEPGSLILIGTGMAILGRRLLARKTQA